MQPLEATRRALQLTRLEDLAASTPFLTTDDDELLSAASDELLSAASGALLLFLWCMGLGGLRTLTSVGHLPFIDIGLCLLYFSDLPALTSLVLLFMAITYWQDAVDWPDQVAKGGVRTASFALYLVAVVADMTWENRAALWENPWAMAAITGVIGIFVERFKTGQPDDAYGGYDVCGGHTFYGTYRRNHCIIVLRVGSCCTRCCATPNLTLRAGPISASSTGLHTLEVSPEMLPTTF